MSARVATAAEAAAASPVIQMIDVDHFYEGQLGWNHALDHLTLTIGRNEFLCILGPSGCGKSTFLKIVAGLHASSGGAVLLNGKPIKGRASIVASCFRTPRCSPG